MRKKNRIKYNDIVKDIINNEVFLLTKNDIHHGSNKYDHLIRVSKLSYTLANLLKLDVVSTTRGAILHDFFTNEEFGSNHGLIQGVVHPDIALTNALGEFELNEKEQNAIAAHMFPLCMTLPRYKESWILTAVDKIIALYEYAANKFSYTRVTGKVTTALSLFLILSFNIITMGRK